MPVGAENQYLTSPFSSIDIPTGMCLRISALGSVEPVAPSLFFNLPVGVSLGPKDGFISPYQIGLCQVNPQAAAIAPGDYLVVPGNYTTLVTQIPGNFVPFNQVSSGFVIVFAVALAPLLSGGGLLRCLIIPPFDFSVEAP